MKHIARILIGLGMTFNKQHVVHAAALRAIGIGVSALVLAGPASAACPDPSRSTTPPFIRVGGKQAIDPTQADTSIAYTVVYRDFVGSPIAGEPIQVDFQNCSDLRLCSFEFNGQTVDCQDRIVRVTTNAAGQARFTVLGGGVNANPPPPPAIAPGAGKDCVQVRITYPISGCPPDLGRATAVIYDQDGAVPPLGVGPAFHNGVHGSDLPIVISEIGSANSGAPYRGRSDFSADGKVNGLDLSAFLYALGLANTGRGSGLGCSNGTGVAVPYCP